MSKRVCGLLMLLVFFSVSVSGCAYFAAKNEIKAAEKATAELKAAGGAKLAPYEYCSAESFLEISKYVLTENSWSIVEGICISFKIGRRGRSHRSKKEKIVERKGVNYNHG